MNESITTLLIYRLFLWLFFFLFTSLYFYILIFVFHIVFIECLNSGLYELDQSRLSSESAYLRDCAPVFLMSPQPHLDV